MFDRVLTLYHENLIKKVEEVIFTEKETSESEIEEEHDSVNSSYQKLLEIINSQYEDQNKKECWFNHQKFLVSLQICI